MIEMERKKKISNFELINIYNHHFYLKSDFENGVCRKSKLLKRVSIFNFVNLKKTKNENKNHHPNLLFTSN